MGKRDNKMDFLKGILVIGMIVCHVFQFFVPLHRFRGAEIFTWYINAVTFSGFIFTFGYTSHIAYFSKKCKDVWHKMFVAGLKLLVAFYTSGIAYRVFIDYRQVDLFLIKQIVLLKDIPGWSEFIVSFAFLLFLGMVGFKLFKWLIGHKKVHLVVTALFLLTTYIPYELVSNNPLGILVGTQRFASFSLLQYMPYYLLGIYFSHNKLRFSMKTLLVSLGLTALTMVQMSLNQWQLPGRFPPTLFWIIAPALPIYLYFLIGYLFTEKLKKNSFVNKITSSVNSIGQNSMYFLLLSNILIFALSGTNAFKELTPYLACVISLLLLLFCHFSKSFVRVLPRG